MEAHDETRAMLRTIRLLREEAENSENKKAIAITDDPKFGQQVLTNQETAFKSSVDGGVEFNHPSENDPEKSPLIYYPENGNLTFSGVIRNIKWQFSLKDESGEGCYVWTDGLQLTDSNIQTLYKLYGFYKNWKDQWNRDEGKLSVLKG